jgi:hypothetical protein
MISRVTTSTQRNRARQQADSACYDLDPNVRNAIPSSSTRIVIPSAYEPRPFGSGQEPTNALTGKEAVSNPYGSREARTCILASEFWLLNSGF